MSNLDKKANKRKLRHNTPLDIIDYWVPQNIWRSGFSGSFHIERFQERKKKTNVTHFDISFDIHT